MNKEGTAKVLLILQTTYPNFKIDNLDFTISVWTDMLAEFEREEVMAALKMAIVNNKSNFAPSISAIINEIHNLREMARGKDDTSEAEAWTLVRKCTSGSMEYDELPEDIQKAIGRSEIRDLGYSEGVNWQVVQSNFLKAYRQVLERKKMDARIPESIRKLVADTSERMRLTDGRTN